MKKTVCDVRKNVITVACWIVLISLTYAAYRFHLYVSPNYLPISYQTQSASGIKLPTVVSMLPLEINVRYSTAVLRFKFRLEWLHAKIYDLYADDCIEYLSINKRQVSNISFPICGGEDGLRLNLKDYLREGENDIVILLANHEGPGRFDMRVSFFDLSSLAIGFAIVFLWAAHFVLIARRYPFAEYSITSWIIIGGVVIRCIYYLSTPYWVRAYDWFEHLDYIRFVANKWAIPPANQGFQFYQTPLYYILTGVYLRLCRSFAIPFYQVITHLQFFSLLLSIATLFLSARLMLLLPNIRHNISFATLFCAIVAFLPSQVFYASRISNDTLALFLSVAALWYLQRWWNIRNWDGWVTLCIIVSLAVLTKFNSVAFLLVLCILAFIATWPYAEKNAKFQLTVLVTFVIVCGWYFYSQRQMTGSFFAFKDVPMNEGLKLRTTVYNLVTFNPVQVLQHTFNDSWQDNSRRQYFLEYLYRSMFFGEFKFPNVPKLLVQAILVLSFVTVPLSLYGMFVAMRSWRVQSIPLFVTQVAFILALGVWRILMPYSSAQDFRLVASMSNSLAFFICIGISGMPRLASQASLFLNAGFLTTWAVFLLWVAFAG